MQLVHRAAARRLMQAVDVLGDDGFQPALPLQLCQPQVGSVGPVSYTHLKTDENCTKPSFLLDRSPFDSYDYM